MGLICIGCTALVAVVFGFATVGKLRNRQAWTDFVATTAAMLPTRRVPPTGVATLVGCAEVGTAGLAVAAVLSPDPTVGLLALGGAAVLLLAFLGGIARVLQAGPAVRCRCFGSGGAVFGRDHLLRNGILLAVVASGLVANLTGAAMPLDAGAIVAATAGGLGGLLVAHWDELAYLVNDPTTR